jgi:hypothetical protein
LAESQFPCIYEYYSFLLNLPDDTGLSFQVWSFPIYKSYELLSKLEVLYTFFVDGPDHSKWRKGEVKFNKGELINDMKHLVEASPAQNKRAFDFPAFFPVLEIQYQTIREGAQFCATCIHAYYSDQMFSKEY